MAEENEITPGMEEGEDTDAEETPVEGAPDAPVMPEGEDEDEDDAVEEENEDEQS